MAAAGQGSGPGAVPAATRLQAYAWCREFLAGSWKLIGPEEFGIGPVRYEAEPGNATGRGAAGFPGASPRIPFPPPRSPSPSSSPALKRCSFCPPVARFPRGMP